MLLLIIGFVLSICAFLGIKIFWKNTNKFKYILGIVPLVAFILISTLAIIPANSVGVIYSPFDGVREDTLPEGWHMKGVFDEIYNISTEVQTKKVENITGQTMDSQYITMIIDVKYKVDTEKAYEVFKQYRNLNNISESLITPTVQRSVESITTQHNIMEILGDKRNEIYTGIENDLKTRLTTNGVTFVSINFIDTDAGEAIEQAIQNEAIAKKAVETAEQEKLKAEIEAQKRVVDALADKDKAEIEAETKIIQAQAEADSNRILSESITDKLLKKMEMEAREKWGWVTVQGGSVITDTRTETEPK